MARIVLRASLWLAPALMAATSPASAAFVQYTSSIPLQVVPFATSFALQKFDSNLGTLTGILLTLGSNITAQVDVWSNLSTPTAFSDAFASLPITVTAMSPDTTSVQATPTAMLASGTALPSMPNGFINSYIGITGTASASALVPPSSWAYYVGLGTGMASFSASTGNGSYGGTGPLGLFFSGSGTADGTFTVRYDYALPTAVPLPGSLGLLSASLALLGLFLLRRTRGQDSPA